MSNSVTMIDSIQKTLCPDQERLDFLPRHTGKHFLRYEQLVYATMDKSCEGYSGGFWHYYTLSNGGFFMALDDHRRFRVECDSNGYEGEMSAEAVSLGVNLFVQNRFAWEIEAEHFSNAFYQLKDFAAEHPEVRDIMAFID